MSRDLGELGKDLAEKPVDYVTKSTCIHCSPAGKSLFWLQLLLQ